VLDKAGLHFGCCLLQAVETSGKRQGRERKYFCLPARKASYARWRKEVIL